MTTPPATSCINVPARWRCCRLINLVAEDNAIEDTIYHLHRALNTGRVDLERFLRVRASSLSVSVITILAWSPG